MPAIDYDSRVHVTRVADRCELAAGVILLGLEAPELVRATRPGQYVMAIPPTGESAATALGIYEAQGARASLLFFPTGKRTHELAALRPGERLDVVGPLGNGFDLSGVPPRRGDRGRRRRHRVGLVGRASAPACRRAGGAVLRSAHRRAAGRAHVALKMRAANSFWLPTTAAAVIADSSPSSWNGVRPRTRSWRAVRRRCCAPSEGSPPSSAYRRSFRSKKRLRAASADAGDASYL